MATLNDMIKSARESYKEGYAAGFEAGMEGALDAIQKHGGLTADELQQVRWLRAIEKEHAA